MELGKKENLSIIRLRAILLGWLLSVAICVLTPYNNIYLQATPLGGGHFPLAPFVILIGLTLLVAAGARLFRRPLWLTGRELLVVWILTVLVSGIAYTGLVRTFFINLTAPFYYASVENRWAETLQPLLPHAWYPQQKAAILSLYEGLPGGRDLSWWTVCRRIPWDVWVVPLLMWGSFVLLCYLVMICLINLISRQWLHNERMNLPLLQVPKFMGEALDTGKLRSFLGNRFLLVGLVLTAGLHTLNGLHFYYPSVPELPTLILAGPYFPPQGLFSGFQKLKIYIYPAFIGFAFLTSRQISLSFWLWFILGGLLVGFLGVLGYAIPPAALGVTFGPTLTHPEETQMIGAYVGFFFFLIWLGRQNYWEILRSALRMKGEAQAHTEWFDVRLSFWMAVFGLLGIASWCQYFGMGFGSSLLLIGAFFMTLVVATRIICQGGIAYFTLTVAPMDMLTAVFGCRLFSQVGIVIAAVVQKLLFVDLRETLMPSLLHAAKLTHRNRNRRQILMGIGVALVLGVAVSYVATLVLCYRYGIRELGMDWANRTTVTVYENIQTLVQSPVECSHWVRVFAVIGTVVMLVLAVCYHRFYWWPIHPIGYLTAYSSAMWILWFSFFLGWLCNTLCMRYGGVALFKRVRFFFMGLIIGDFLMGGIWGVVGLFGHASYQVLPT